jgi:two-component system phosphate regulon sensor histidine kinase PhoR
MNNRRRLLWQLVPSYMLVTIVSLVVVTGYASSSFKSFYLEQRVNDLKERAYLLQDQIIEHLDPLDENRIDALCKKLGPLSATRFTVILPSGKVIGDSSVNPRLMDNHLDRPEVMQALRDNFGISVRTSNTLQKEMMYVSLCIRNGPRIYGFLREAVSLTAIEMAIVSAQKKIAFGSLFVAIFAASISFYVSFRISRPLEDIRKGAERFASGDFEGRLSVTGSREIGSLSESMNKMAAELRQRFDIITRQRVELETILSSMMEGVLAVDRNEKVIMINDSAAKTFGLDLEKAHGRSLQEVIRNSAIHKVIGRSLTCHEPIEKDVLIYDDLLGERVMTIHCAPWEGVAEEKIGTLAVFNDVTRLRKLESIRREFVSNVSHELKTPVTAIKASVETLMGGAINNKETFERFLNIIERHADRLEAIIENLLSLSRIEQGDENNEIRMVKQRLRAVLESAVQALNVKIDAKDIKAELACDDSITVKANRTMLEEAVINLLDNAIKFSNSKSIIRIKVTQTDSETVIRVTDHGCGIEERHLDRIFERFYRVDKGRSRDQGGTGLGLAIVKHIARIHGGRVSVESAIGTGSSFSVHLPLF